MLELGFQVSALAKTRGCGCGIVGGVRFCLCGGFREVLELVIIISGFGFFLGLTAFAISELGEGR